MNAVGRLGSYISRSVNTVSGPFHPFGGAVDIIVVEQEDGSFKSSPWYVRFGKFQGVLKSKEKVVSINVNGVDADFNMYLDHKGEAYFLREEEAEGDSLFSPSSSGEDTDGQQGNRRHIKSKSWNCDSTFPDSVAKIEVSNRKSVSRTNSRRSRIFGFVFGRNSVNGNKFSGEENGSGVVRAESLERAEIAADLLEVKWSTSFASSSSKKDKSSQSSTQDALKDDTNKDLKKNDGQNNEDSGMNQNLEDNLDGLMMHAEANSAGSGKNRNSPSSFQKVENSVEGIGVEISRSLCEDGVSGNQSTICRETSHSQTIAWDDSCRQTNLYREVCVQSEVLHVKTDSVPEEMSQRGNGTSNGSLNVQELFIERSHIFVEGNRGLESEITSPNSLTDNSVTQSSSQVVTIQSPNGFHERVESCRVSTISSACNLISEVQEGTSVRKEVGDTQKPDGGSGLLSFLASEISEEEQLLFGDLDEFTLNEVKNLEFASQKEEEADLWLSPQENEGATESSPKYETSSSPDNSHVEDTHSYANDGTRKLKTTKSDVDMSIGNKVQPKEIPCTVRSLPNMWSLDDRIANDHGHSLDRSLDSVAERSKRLLPTGTITCGKSGSDDVGQSTLAQQATQDSKVIGKLEDRQTNFPGDDPCKSIDASGGGWKIWPFPSKRSGSTDVSRPALNSNGKSDAENISRSPSSKDEQIDVPKINIVKKKIIALTPTSEQLATLNLKEGRNSVTFTFSTAMLGQQQVDARIYLWRWDTRIVISDVDGTITRSDVLGQFMPLVGVDWSQTGVAHLFSAIKENGYQLLFLSARAISQAYHTRQFLFNLKQDGKTLPDGPVVISPDGLFPSLFREVVRRAPHEFKIACLEEIKALFPSDRNPFYAGFGNRDTDELSYIKVGIPKGKIFIINPKGEIVVNRHIDTKSYTSLHALVNRMFPPMPVSEQEDFNTWNFWKLPPPAINM